MGKDVNIGDFLHRIKRPVVLDPCSKYKLVTVKLYHKGVILRREALGSELKSKMYEVKTGDFILSGIDARNGAFGIVPPELDGAIVTNDFWYFDIDQDIVEKYFFLELTSTLWFDEICRKGSDGTTQRIRLQKNKFFNQKIHLPDLIEQQSFIASFKRVKDSNGELTSELTHQQMLLKKLRQQILQDAIEGKLTAEWRKQNPDIEPASELLKRIQAEKAKLVKEGKIKKQKPLPPISEKEKLFKLPDSWEWCRLGDLCNTITKGSSPKWQGINYVNSYEEGILFITSKNVDNFRVDLSNSTFVEKEFNKIEPRSVLKKGDLLTNIVGASIGRTAVYDLDYVANINQAVCLLRIEHESVLKSFMLKLMNANFITQLMLDMQFSPGRANLSMENLARFPVALPPLLEQKVIVAKVEKLFALCDQLESQITQNQTNAEQLMQAVLKETFSNEQKT